jgi:hypothetical protein
MRPPSFSHLQRKSSLPCSREPHLPPPPPTPPSTTNDLHHTQINSTPTTITTPRVNQNDKQPLKSCLKRKESTASQQSNTPNSAYQQQSQQSTHTQPPRSIPGNNTNNTNSSITSLSSSTSTNNRQTNASMIVMNTNTNHFSLKKSNVKMSEQMFVPYVGHLFTCDHESTKRYVYYNNLEKNRRTKIYRQLIRNKNEKLIKLINQTLYDDDDNEDGEDEEEGDEDDEEEEEEDDDDEYEDEDECRYLEDKPKIHPLITSKSDNDLRFRKSVKFIPHANTTINIRTEEAISPSSTITTNDTTTSASSTPTEKGVFVCVFLNSII